MNHNGRVFLGQPSEERGNTHPASISLLQGELLDRQLSFMSSNASFLFIAHLAAPGIGSEPAVRQLQVCRFARSNIDSSGTEFRIHSYGNENTHPRGRTALQLQDYKAGLLDGSTEVLE